MPNALIPELDGRRLSVDVALDHPTILRARIAALADSQLLLDKFFTASEITVQGGGILHSVIKAGDYYTAGGLADAEERSPGSEYRTVEGVQPTPKLATVRDWGGRFQVLDEQRVRNDVSYVDNQITQLSNTLVRRLNAAAVDAIETSLTENQVPTIPGSNWSSVITVGPPETLTPNNKRPAADFAAAQFASDLEELGVVHDLLIVAPQQAYSLRVTYGPDLAEVLASAGLEMFASPRVTPGTAYAVEKGAAGVVAFEYPLTTIVYREEETRSSWVQSFAVPAFAVERPAAVKKITGLAG